MSNAYKDRMDWRANISDIDNLYDVDPAQMLVFLRHQFLVSAKDMACDEEEWSDMGQDCAKAAESLQDALDALMPDQEWLRE